MVYAFVSCYCFALLYFWGSDGIGDCGVGVWGVLGERVFGIICGEVQDSRFGVMVGEMMVVECFVMERFAGAVMMVWIFFLGGRGGGGSFWV